MLEEDKKMIQDEFKSFMYTNKVNNFYFHFLIFNF